MLAMMGELTARMGALEVQASEARANGGAQFSQTEQRSDERTRRLESVRSELGAGVLGSPVEPRPKARQRKAAAAPELSTSDSEGFEDEGPSMKEAAGWVRGLAKELRRGRPGSEDEGEGAGAGTRGFVAKERQLRRYRRHPLRKYRHVMGVMRQELRGELLAGVEEPTRSVPVREGDAQLAADYFHRKVPLARFRLAQQLLSLVQRLHASLLRQDQAAALGLVAAVYQFVEQYALDEGRSDLAWMMTQEVAPVPSEYTATAVVVEAATDGVGKLVEPPVLSAAIQEAKDMQAFRTGRDALRKGQEPKHPK